MLITIKNKNRLAKNTFTLYTFRLALTRINEIGIGVDGIKLDQFLRKNYSMGLRDACRRLVYSMHIDYKYEEAVIYFPNPTMDNLARLITYGTGEIKGISILRKLFTPKERN